MGATGLREQYMIDKVVYENGVQELKESSVITGNFPKKDGEYIVRQMDLKTLEFNYKRFWSPLQHQNFYKWLCKKNLMYASIYEMPGPPQSLPVDVVKVRVNGGKITGWKAAELDGEEHTTEVKYGSGGDPTYKFMRTLVDDFIKESLLGDKLARFSIYDEVEFNRYMNTPV